MDKDEEGRFSETRSDREVLDAVADHAPAATTDVAEALELTRQAADYRLRRLREAERVRGEKIGGTLIWTVTEDPDEEIGDDEDDDRERREPDEPESSDDLEARIRELDAPGSGFRLDDRVAATAKVVRYLEEVGEASTQELKARLDDDEVGYADVDSYWANFIRGGEVLKQLSEIKTPGKGEKIYRYD